METGKEPMTVGQWVGTILITCIPIVGLIMLLIWAFSESTNENKANWAKAYLLCIIIGIAAWMMFGAAIVGALYGVAGSL